MSSSLITKALKALPANAPESRQTLLRELGERISDDDAADFDPKLLAMVTESHWNLAQKRKDRQPQIKIYTPSIAKQKLRLTVIDVVSKDMAFLVDSVVAEINRHNLLIDFMVHPILYARADSAGKLVEISSKRDASSARQSHIHIQIKGSISEDVLAQLEAGLYQALEDAYAANRDWEKMLARLKEACEELTASKTSHPKAEIAEYCAFLNFLHDNNFTLLGFREYEFVEEKGVLKSKTVKGRSLGVLNDDIRPAYISEREEGLPRNLQELRRGLPAVSVSKTNRLATVHRRVPMDAIAIKTYDKNGKVKGEKLFLGLFTSVTYSRSVSDVPLLRRKVEDVVNLSDFLPQSHNRKALRHILEKYPRDELFQIPEKDLFEICLDILRLQERQHIALFMRRDPFGRYISCLVYIPRDRFSTSLRKQIGNIIEEQLDGTCTTFTTSLDDSVFARVMFIITVSQDKPPKYNPEHLEMMLQEAGQTWPERLSDALADTYEDDDQITALTLKYGEAFPLAYTTRYRAKHSIFDIAKIEAVQQSKRIGLDLYKTNDLAPNQLKLKVYNPSTPLNLSDVIPILENMGLQAISELPFEIKPANADSSVWIHDFMLEINPGNTLALAFEDLKANFETAFTRIWYLEMENFGLNELVLKAGLNWSEVTILRAYVRYLKQIRYPFEKPYIEKALTQNPDIARIIVDAFKAFHDPSAKDHEKRGNDCIKAAETALEKVESFDQDRILRNFISLVQATLRTNYFLKDKDGQQKLYLSMKLDSKSVPGLPEPKPYREIFVYSPRFEAIHLRGDVIARGGLRWSDRHEDFRTEVLGLLRAQMVKNSVIVPVGAKGGFVVKTPIKDRKAFMAEGIECYKIFIRGLLDITDNRKGTKVVPPKNIVRRDGDDPYLVVAADKGTASFSDIANSLSQEYGFWLDDAFASGGSAGYDHKKMGITAKGGWESVKLHFRHLNHNIQKKPFDVIGVGDMGGDVFGNGMLLSEQIHLVGAFNHVHIFCDPNPNPAVSFQERDRLFKAVSGWEGYDLKKLSKGGRIYSRSEKLLTLTPEIRERFEITAEKVSPIDLMRAMLKARADLLWFGGIGTYIKSTNETHADVGDKANENMRIDGSEVRALVIGEGANLAVTQRGRVEFAEKGGRINTDFLDNSGGVDSSDHEVNIKILLTDVMTDKANAMDLKSRNKLLEQMTNDVAKHVLRNNYQQAQAISLAEFQSHENLKIQEEFIQEMERERGLKRASEGLPSVETIEHRLRTGHGLTRPELCVLLSHAKINFTKDLLATDIPDSPEMQDWVFNYFPEVLRKKFPKEIARHRLRREIIAMSLANSLINRLGPTFIKSCTKKTGASSSDIAKAYIIVREVFELRALWDKVEALDNKVPAELQLKAMKEIAGLTEHAVTWFLTRLGRDSDIRTDIKNYHKGVSDLRAGASKILMDDLKEATELRIVGGERDGLPKDLAKEIAFLPVLSSACDITRISLEQKTDLMTTAHVYFDLGQKFQLGWLRQQARFVTSDDPWQAEATSGLIDQLYGAQAGLTIQILRDTKGRASKEQSIVEKWLAQNSGKARQIEALLVQLKRAGTVDLPMLVIAEQRLRNLIGL